MAPAGIEPQSLPPWLRERVIEHHIFQPALSVATVIRDARTVAQEAVELQTIAAIGLSVAAEAAGHADTAQPGLPQSIAQTAALQALAAACGATTLRLRSQALSEGPVQAQRFLETTRALLLPAQASAAADPPRTAAPAKQPAPLI